MNNTGSIRQYSNEACRLFEGNSELASCLLRVVTSKRDFGTKQYLKIYLNLVAVYVVMSRTRYQRFSVRLQNKFPTGQSDSSACRLVGELQTPPALLALHPIKGSYLSEPSKINQSAPVGSNADSKQSAMRVSQGFVEQGNKGKISYGTTEREPVLGNAGIIKC